MHPADALALALWRPPQNGLGAEPYSDLPGLPRTDIQQTPEEALSVAAQQFPGHDVLLIQTNLSLPSGFLSRMTAAWKQYPDVEVLSPLDKESGSTIPQLPPEKIDVQQFLFGEHGIRPGISWARHGSLWRAGVLNEVFTSGQRLSGQLNFSVLHGVHVAGEFVQYDGNEAFIGDGKPVVLHVLHSWGGGVEHFARDLRAGDKDRHHLFLKALSVDSLPPFGKQLALYHSSSEIALQLWRLNSPIDDTAIESAEVRKILQEIIDRWGVGAVIVSSLIGHSLDVLKTGLPTVFACHDVYPCWPLLHDRRELDEADFTFEYLQDFLARNSGEISFSKHTAEYWAAIKDHLVETILGRYISCIAPSEYARKRLCAIDGRLNHADWRIIPHGTIALDRVDRSTDVPVNKLRVLVPGHVNGEKGETLLLAMLKKMPPDIELVLLGCAGYLEHKFRHEAVRCYPEYLREDLSAWVAKIKPDIAMLPSLVPETFGYVLSEMLVIGLPVLCADIGAYAERATSEDSVVTVAPNAEAFIGKLQYFRDSRAELEKLAAAPPAAISTLSDMASAWERACRANEPNWFFDYPASRQLQEESAMDRKIDQLMEISIKANNLHQEQQRKSAETIEQLMANQKQLEDRFEKLQAELFARDQALALAAEKLEASLVTQGELKSALLEQEKQAQERIAGIRKLQTEQQEQNLVREGELKSQLLQQQKNHIELLNLQLQQNETYQKTISDFRNKMEENSIALENKMAQLESVNKQELAARDANIQALMQQLHDATAELHHKAGELRYKTDELQAVYASSSWRYTGIFRKVKTWFIQ